MGLLTQLLKQSNSNIVRFIHREWVTLGPAFMPKVRHDVLPCRSLNVRTKQLHCLLDALKVMPHPPVPHSVASPSSEGIQPEV